MSELKVDKITPRQGTTLTLGDSGDTINFGSGVLPNFENLTVTGDFTVDTNSLKVDSTNNRVGIGKTSPSVSLDVVGAVTATGTITANSFSGDGSSLTGITSTTINNNANNRLITGSDTANTLEGEANLTFDGSTLALTGNMTVSGTVDGQDVAAVATTANAALPKAGGTMTGDIDLGDNVKATYGNGEDLIIFHDGTNSIIKEQGGGDLIIRGEATIKIQNEDGSETYANFKHNDSVELFTNGTKVFQTISDGVEILGHCRPSASNTYDLGTSSLVWRNIYTSDLNMSNEGLDKGNDVDGTKGSWTFQEGSDDLFLLNNKNGKKYKFKLEECK